METSDAIKALGSLAQETRLQIFRHLVRIGANGAAAGEIATALGQAPSTLSFHLRHLEESGLIVSRRESRSIRYSLKAQSLNELIWFLGEDCCQGRNELCSSPTARIQERRKEARKSGRPIVLFVCTQNSARSQMAEALLRHEAPDRFEVMSGGLQPAALHPLALKVLREIHVETDTLISQDLGEILGKYPIHDAIVVCDQAQEECPRIIQFARNQHFWPFDDPARIVGSKVEKLTEFRRIRDAIHERIKSWLHEGTTARRSGP